MEEFNKNISQQGLQPWPKRGIDLRSFTMMNPSTLPLLAPSSFQVWKKPYFMKHSGSRIPLSSSSNLSLESDDIVNTDEMEAGVHGRLGRNLDPNLDPKKLKRIISNRVSAQKSRMKKLQYVTEMERKAKALEAEIAVLHPQVAMYRNQQHFLQMEQDRLNQQVSSRSVNKILKDAEIEDHKAEVNRLRQLHLTLQQQKMQEQMMVPAAWQEQIVNPNLSQSGTQQMLFFNSKTGNAAEMDNELNGQQLLGQMWMPTLAPALMLNPNGPTMMQQKLKTNSNLGGIEQILNFNMNPHSYVK